MIARVFSSGYGYFLWSIIALIMAFSNAAVFSDPDTAWHLAAGDLIRSLHAIPRQDSWSFTAQEEYWYNLSWLYDIGVSLLFQYTGFSGIFTLTIMVFAASTVIIATHCVRRGASPLLVSAYSICIALPVIHTVLLARPAMLSLLFAVCIYLLLWRLREIYADRREALKYSALILSIMLLWVNIHGGFLLGLVLIGVFLAEALFCGDRVRAQCIGIVLTGALGVTLVNPYGFSVYYGAWRTLTSAYNVVLTEWQPAAIGKDGPMTLLFLVMVWLNNTQDKKLPLVDRLLTILLFILAMTALRHSAVAALLAMPCLTLRASALLGHGAASRWIKERDIILMRDMGKCDIRIMMAGVCVITIALMASPYPRDTLLKKPIGFPEETFPIEEAAYVAEHYPTARIINDYNMGGYLDYLWKGQPKVFVDGRADSLYSAELLQDYRNFMGSNGWGARADMLVQYYHIDGVLLTHDIEKAGHWRDNPAWKAVHYGKTATLYMRKPINN